MEPLVCRFQRTAHFLDPYLVGPGQLEGETVEGRGGAGHWSWCTGRIVLPKVPERTGRDPKERGRGRNTGGV